jgi:hypothetical protein
MASAAMRTITLEEVILINVAVGGGVALNAANGIGTSHRRIIEAEGLEVNVSLTVAAVPEWNSRESGECQTRTRTVSKMQGRN